MGVRSAFLATIAYRLKCLSAARAIPCSKLAPSTTAQVPPGLALIICSSGTVSPVNGRASETGFKKDSPCGSSAITAERNS